MEKIRDESGAVLEPGRIYGMGPSRTKLVPYDVYVDVESGEEMARIHGTLKDPEMIYGQDWTRPKYVVALNPDLTEIVAPDKEMSFEERINNYQLEISIKRSGLELIEKNICAMLGTVVGDGSLLSDCVMRMVWDGDEASVQQLTQAYYSSGGQTAAA